MISASEIHDLRFEKVAFGYKQEEIDDFLARLEDEVEDMQQDLDDKDEKIKTLADKVRECLNEQEAVGDALLSATHEAHRITADANRKAEEIIANAKEQADQILDDVTVQHDALVKKNEDEIAILEQKLVDTRKKVADFKQAITDMYKEHLKMVMDLPSEDNTTFGTDSKVDTGETVTRNTPPKPTARAVQNAYESRFGDLDTDDKEKV